MTGDAAPVTVVIPTKDRRDLLLETLACALGQEGVDVSVVLVDDGSSTPVREFLPPDARVLVVRNERPTGVSAARNRGLAEVRTPWVAFVDDDDLWAPDKTRRQLTVLHETGRRWACSGAIVFSADEVLAVYGPPDGDEVGRLLLGGNVVPGGGSGVLVETALLREVGGFDEGLASLADWDCWIRLSRHSAAATVAAPSVGYRVHAQGMAHDVPRQERELRRMQESYRQVEPRLALSPDAAYWGYLARLEYRSGNWAAGWRRTVRLLRSTRRPGPLMTPARHLMPPAVQRWSRRVMLRRWAAAYGEQDLAWIRPHLRA